MHSILITGASGQLGSEIKELASHETDIRFYFTDVQDLDITDKASVRRYIEQNQINGIINCAAYTAVDKAEDELELAMKVNVSGPKVLAELANEFSLRFIHISTDYVFDGQSYLPYTEDQAVKPIGAYGRTKLDGEKAVMENCPGAIIIRTSWLYSSFGNNFVKTMLRLMETREEIGVIFDQVGTPTYAADLAAATLAIIADNDFATKAGIYHFSDEGATSWYDFAMAIHDLANMSCRVKPLMTSEYPTKTQRPHYSVLNKTKIKTSFGLKIPYWRDSLSVCLSKLKQPQLVG